MIEGDLPGRVIYLSFIELSGRYNALPSISLHHHFRIVSLATMPYWGYRMVVTMVRLQERLVKIKPRFEIISVVKVKARTRPSTTEALIVA
jgi:hypothetical protein